MSIFFEILVVSVLTSLTLAIPGNMLVLRGTSLSTFALSHSMFVGIVLAYLVVDDLNSPFLIVGAAITGVFIVWLVELLAKSQYINIDAALGLVYLFFFATGIILVSRYTANTRLSVESALFGSISSVVFDRWQLGNIDLGPTVLWYLIILVLINILVLFLFYKELKISLFDIEYARIYGLLPDLLNLLYMTLISVTIVITFQVAGLIIVVALATIPGATALQIVQRFPVMMLVSAGFAILASVIGVWIAWEIGDVEVASVISTVSGILFITTVFVNQLIRKRGGNYHG